MKVINIIISLVIIYFLYAAYQYGVDLANCKCVESVKENIYFIKNIEIILIAISLFGILGNILGSIYDKFIKKNMLKVLPFFIIYLITMFIILVFFVYNVYVFATNTGNCECADQWQKNILYIQSIVYSFSVFGMLFISIMLINSKMKK